MCGTGGRLGGGGIWRTTRVNRTLTGVLSCWLGTPLLSAAANGFIIERKERMMCAELEI